MTAINSSDLHAQKQALRRNMLARRKTAKALHPDAAKVLCNKFLSAFPLPSNNLIAGYSAQRDEIDPLPLTFALRETGHQFCLPVVTDRALPLAFRSWHHDMVLTPGIWGIPEPPATAPAVSPTILLVPLLAFDRNGQRLGYGSGFYDRTLAHLRSTHKITAIGLGFAAQEVPAVPHGSWDARLDAIVTESAIFRF